MTFSMTRHLKHYQSASKASAVLLQNVNSEAAADTHAEEIIQGFSSSTGPAVSVPLCFRFI